MERNGWSSATDEPITRWLGILPGVVALASTEISESLETSICDQGAVNQVVVLIDRVVQKTDARICEQYSYLTSTITPNLE
jgi:hypothetical protein